jgi:dnd system-associated protein 4
VAEGRDRYYVAKDKHHIFQALSGDDGPFEYLKDAFVFAAAIGFRFERHHPIEGERQHVGFWHYLSESRDQPLINAIAIAETGGLEVLADRGAVIEIAEAYANGGVAVLLELDRYDRDATLVSIASEVLDLTSTATSEVNPSAEPGGAEQVLARGL